MTTPPATRSELALSGVIVPMITPLTAEGEIDGPAIDRLVAHLLAGGVSGIFVLGGSGEGPWLAAAQRRRVVETTARSVAGRVPVLAGVLAPGTGAALDDVGMVDETGADAVVVTSPYYFAPDAAAQVSHVRAVAAASRLPVVLYNIPQMTHHPFDAATVRDLAALDNVVAVKDSAGEWPAFEALLGVRAGRPEFRVLQGAEPLAARSLLAGADGLIPGLGNLVPDLYAELVAKAGAGDAEAAFAVQARIDALWALHAHGYWLVCLKYAASLLGFGSGAAAGRDQALPSPAKAAIERLMEPYAAAVT